jgi:hypothetical protein
MNSKDIILIDDIEVENGDLKVSYSDDQHIEHMLRANPGQYYQYPDVGYGIYTRLNGKIDPQTERKLIKKSLENDNYTIPMDGIIINPDTGVFHVEKYVRKS